MTSATPTSSQNSLYARSTAWLQTNQPLPEVKRALGAIVSRVAKGTVCCDEDCRKACDALTQHYVDRGGDPDDLPMLAADVVARATRSQPQPLIEPDYGSLHPDTPPGPTLSAEERSIRFKELKALLSPRGGV